MKWLGLTGGIGSGKSEVSRRLRSLNHQVVDADELARQAVKKDSKGYRKIIQTFGRVLDQDDNIDRSKLAKIVFADLQQRLRLEAITHPLIEKLRLAEKNRLESMSLPFAFYDIPLLYEKKLMAEFDYIILVYCSEQQQKERLAIRNNFSKIEIEQRLKAQISLNRKKILSDFIVDNTGPLSALDGKINALLDDLKSKIKIDL